MPDALWSKAPGPTAIPPRSVDICNCDSKTNPKSSRTSVGRPKSGCANATDDWWPRGKHANVVTVAIARELVGFMWAIAKEVPVTPVRPKDRIETCILVRTQKVCQRASEETQPRCGVTLGSVKRPVQGYSCLDRGRHPTDASKVVPNPRIAAGSTVVSYWLRLFRCTKVKKHHEDLKKVCSRLLTLEVIATPGVSRCRKRERAGADAVSRRLHRPCPHGQSQRQNQRSRF